jgi:Lon protease-like protein
LIEVALFPIPNCVAFPGTSFPLHVFEPRYREMVQRCVTENLPMAITHTEAVIRQARPQQTVAEAMHSNQATYKPYTIFSAGQVELIETLDDGRMMIDVHLTDRLYAVNEIQTLPYFVYECDVLEDKPITDDIRAEAELLKQKLLTRLIAMTAHSPDVNELLRSELWQKKDVVKFSFELFGMVRMEGDIQQQILQCRSPVERLHIALQMLNRLGKTPN